MAGLLLLPVPLFAAGTDDEWLARWWQTEEGLPDNSVNGLAQTSDGYLWVGTPTGLARFDGLQFETIPLTSVISQPNRGIVSMLRGRHHGLWLAMDRGAVVRLSGNTSRAYIKNLPKFIPNNMAEDAAGDLWIAYHGGSVYRVNEDQATLMDASNGLPSGIDICALTTDNHGRVWFGKSGEVGIYTNGSFHTVCRLQPQPVQMAQQSMRLTTAQDGNIWVCYGFHLYKCGERGIVQDYGEFRPEISGTVATVMLEDHDGYVWIGTSYSGLYRHGPSGFQAVAAVSHTGILSLAEDREGNIWVGTYGGGLNRIRLRAITLEATGTGGLPFPSVESICEASDGTVWAVTQNGVLAHKVDDHWFPIPVSTNWPGDATCVNTDNHGNIWVGTHLHGLYCWRDGKFVDWDGAEETRGLTYHTLIAGRNGDLWVGQETPGAVVRLHEGKLTSFPVPPANRIIRAMVEDAAGVIWAGTSAGNLMRITDDKLIDVTPRPMEDLAPIRCLYATTNGALWIGYAGSGVGYLKDGHYTEISSEQGLFDDYISHIVADNEGWIWLASNRGIVKVRQEDFEDFAAGKISHVRSVHYGRGDGLPSLAGTFGDSPDVLRSHDGRLWIPMLTALAVIDPSKLSDNVAPPPALLTRVSVDRRIVAQYNGILPPQKNPENPVIDLASRHEVLHLSPDHGSITFDFTAFNFSAPENIEFRHRLVGGDDDNWLESGTVRSVPYPRLPNGTYKFEVSASNGDGNWTELTSQVALVVAPFFWQRWWFRLAEVATFTFIVIAIVRYVSFRRLRAQLRVLEQQAALQRERARIAKDIHDDLGANLTQIAYLGELANQDRSEPNLVGERIGKISATARQAVKSLDEIVWAVNPRNDTLANLLDYAGQFAVDYLRLMGIRCRLDFPTEVPERELSTDLRHNLFLVVKEALHNIFKHANATEVWLRATVNAQALEVCIEDNGRGFTSTPDDALADGLRNMKQRMNDIGGDFRVESQPGSGTRIILRLPWPEMNN